MGQHESGSFQPLSRGIVGQEDGRKGRGVEII